MQGKTTFLAITLLIFISASTLAQFDSHFVIDDNSMEAIDITNNKRYNGVFQSFYKNKQTACRFILQDGKPIEMKNWYKNGQLCDSTIYINGFNLFKRFTFDSKGRIISEEILNMKSIAESDDKKLLRTSRKKKYANSTVYEDCLSYRIISYTRKNTPKFTHHTWYDQSKTLIVLYHKNGNVSDSTFFSHKSFGKSKYILLKQGTRIEYDCNGNKKAEKVFENNILVKETLFEKENSALQLYYTEGKLAKNALLISENGENEKVCVKLNWQGNPKIL